MDVSRSESAHQDVPIGPVTLVIQQSADEILLEKRTNEKSNSPVSIETLTFRLDGSETTNTGKTGVPIQVKAHWDGPTLVAETAREMNGSTVTTVQMFQLGANGNEMKVDKTLTVQHGYQGAAAEKVTGHGTDTFIRAAKPGSFR